MKTILSAFLLLAALLSAVLPATASTWGGVKVFASGSAASSSTGTVVDGANASLSAVTADHFKSTGPAGVEIASGVYRQTGGSNATPWSVGVAGATASLTSNGLLTVPSANITGTAPSLTATGANFTAAVTIAGSTLTVKPASNIPSLEIKQNNDALYSWKLHNDSTNGNLKFIRTDADPGSTRVQFLLGGGIGVADGPSTFGSSVTVNGNGYWNGNLGIGTASPGAKLHSVSATGIQGAFRGWNTSNGGSADSGAIDIGNYAGGSVGGRIDYEGAVNGDLSFLNAYSPGGFIFGRGVTRAGGSQNFQVGTSTLVILGASGNVGIGTASPTSKLHVSGDMSISGSITGASSPTFKTGGQFWSAAAAVPSLGTHSGGFSLRDTGNTYGLDIGKNSSGDVWMQSHRVDASAVAYGLLLNPQGGNVGIGNGATTGGNLAGKFDVLGDAYFGNAATRSTFTTTGALNTMSGETVGTGLRIRRAAASGASTGVLDIWHDNTGSLNGYSFSVDTVKTMTLSNAGQVGIGTSSPCSTCTLHVAGNESVTGTGNFVGTVNLPRIVAPGLSYAGGSAYVAFSQPDVLFNVGNAGTYTFYVEAAAKAAMDVTRMTYSVAEKNYSRTKAQLLAITPAVGDMYYCSDCSDPTSSKPTVVIGTAAVQGAFGTLPVGAFQ